MVGMCIWNQHFITLSCHQNRDISSLIVCVIVCKHTKSIRSYSNIASTVLGNLIKNNNNNSNCDSPNFGVQHQRYQHQLGETQLSHLSHSILLNLLGFMVVRIILKHDCSMAFEWIRPVIRYLFLVSVGCIKRCCRT